MNTDEHRWEKEHSSRVLIRVHPWLFLGLYLSREELRHFEGRTSSIVPRQVSHRGQVSDSESGEQPIPAQLFSVPPCLRGSFLPVESGLPERTNQRSRTAPQSGLLRQGRRVARLDGFAEGRGGCSWALSSVTRQHATADAQPQTAPPDRSPKVATWATPPNSWRHQESGGIALASMGNEVTNGLHDGQQPEQHCSRDFPR